MAFNDTLWITLTLLNDAALGRGDGVAGLVDAEVQHDVYGLPYLGGKTLKGLLAAECAEILYALGLSGNSQMDKWQEAATCLFGNSGSDMETAGRLIVGNAQLPDDLRRWIQADFHGLSEADKGKQQRANLASLTAVRKQTAVDAETGAAKDNTLRTMRVVIHGVSLTARLDFTKPIPERACWLLAASTQTLRRAGTGRNRGRGRIQATLFNAHNQPVSWFADFAREVRHERDHISD